MYVIIDDTNKWLQIYVGLVSYGIGHSTSAIASWRLLFLVLGSISFVFSILLWIFMPDHPNSPRFLSEKQRIIAVQRLAVNNSGVENKVRGSIVAHLQTSLLTPPIDIQVVPS